MSKFRLQYISDIHLEHRIVLPVIPKRANYLALLGDIGYPNSKIYKEFLEYSSKNWDKVFLLSGNHEYDLYPFHDVDTQIKGLVSKYKNIHYLNDSEYSLGEYSILGTTLWTKSTNPLIHDKSISWLKNSIDTTVNKDKKIIILSHHLPSYQLIVEKYHSERYKKYQHEFATELEHLIKDPVKAWLCGHSHCQVEKNINGVYCGINAIGLPIKDDNRNIGRVLEL